MGILLELSLPESASTVRSGSCEALSCGPAVPYGHYDVRENECQFAYTDAVRAAIYTRLSQDRDGTETATARQESDARRWCADHGHDVVAVYRDADISAFHRRKRRPDFERMLDDIASQEVDLVVVWRTDRFTRQPSDIERFVSTAERTGAQLVSVMEPFDSRTGTGLWMLRLFANNANLESAVKSERVRRAHLALAQSGGVSGGGRRPFGYAANRIDVVDDEAELIREAADRLLHGAGVGTIAREWNEAGVATVTGAPWSSTTVKRLLTSPRIAGLRSHRGVVSARAVWKPIIEESQHHALVARLGSGRFVGRSATPRSYVLGGFVFCGLCEARMTTRPGSNGKRRYWCSKQRHGGCDRNGIDAAGTETEVAHRLFIVLDTGALADMSGDAQDDELTELQHAISAAQQRLEDLGRELADAVVGKTAFLAMERHLEERIAHARRRLLVVENRRPSLSLPVTEDEIAQSWPRLSLEQQRAVIDAWVERVVVKPAVRGRNFFDAERVEVRWRR